MQDRQQLIRLQKLYTRYWNTQDFDCIEHMGDRYRKVSNVSNPWVSPKSRPKPQTPNLNNTLTSFCHQHGTILHLKYEFWNHHQALTWTNREGCEAIDLQTWLSCFPIHETMLLVSFMDPTFTKIVLKMSQHGHKWDVGRRICKSNVAAVLFWHVRNRQKHGWIKETLKKQTCHEVCSPCHLRWHLRRDPWVKFRLFPCLVHVTSLNQNLKWRDLVKKGGRQQW